MQGGYMLIAEISRRVLEMNDENLLADVLEFDTEAKTLTPLVPNYAQRMTDLINTRYDASYKIASVTSAVKVVVPGLKGLAFVPYQKREKPASAAKADLEARVAELEAQMQRLLPLLD